MNVLEPIAVPYIENLTVPQETWDKIEEGLDQVDAFVIFCYRIPKLEKYRKTTIVFSNGNEGADLCARIDQTGKLSEDDREMIWQRTTEIMRMIRISVLIW